MSDKVLRELGPGEKGRVVKIRGGGDFHRRLMNMGLTFGHTVEMVRGTSAGSSIEVKVKGHTLSLPEEEAARIYVEMI
jgi:Fe2+ transport system protein FeoA